MDIGAPIRELGPVDVTCLSEAILRQEDDAWREYKYRQKSYHHHEQTESIVLIFTTGEGWPDHSITQGPGWNRLSDAALPLMKKIIAEHYPPGGEVIRAMAAKLLAGGKIKTHADAHPSFHCGHRIHVPITANSRVRWSIDGRPYKFSVGQAYELNNQKPHSVVNKGKEDRITFIFDHVPPGPLAYQPD